MQVRAHAFASAARQGCVAEIFKARQHRVSTLQKMVQLANAVAVRVAMHIIETTIFVTVVVFGYCVETEQVAGLHCGQNEVGLFAHCHRCCVHSDCHIYAHVAHHRFVSLAFVPTPGPSLSPRSTTTRVAGESCLTAMHVIYDVDTCDFGPRRQLLHEVHE